MKTQKADLDKKGSLRNWSHNKLQIRRRAPPVDKLRTDRKCDDLEKAAAAAAPAK